MDAQDMTKITLRAKLLVKFDDFNGYIKYVFENLDNPVWDNRYIMCTRVPNWKTSVFKIGDIGYLTYQEVVAGEDMWYNFQKHKPQYYLYSNLYFIDFLKEADTKNLKDYTL